MRTGWRNLSAFSAYCWSPPASLKTREQTAHNSDYVQDKNRIFTGACMNENFSSASIFCFVCLSGVIKRIYPSSKPVSFHRCRLLLSLSLSLCDVAMLSVGKGGGPASRSNDADCISAPPTKIIKHRLIKLNFKRPDLGSFIDMSNLQIKINLQRHLCTDFEEMNRIVFPLFL